MATNIQLSKPLVTGPKPAAPDQGGDAVLERLTQKIEPPRMYQVCLLYTSDAADE